MADRHPQQISIPMRPDLPEIHISHQGRQPDVHGQLLTFIRGVDDTRRTRARGISDAHERTVRYVPAAHGTASAGPPHSTDRLELPGVPYRPFGPTLSDSDRERATRSTPYSQSDLAGKGVTRRRPRSAGAFEETLTSTDFQPPAKAEASARSSPRANFSPSTFTSSSSTGSLQYCDLADDEIRLLQLQPQRMTIIKCTIIHASLRNPGKYKALSYAWGDSDRSEDIEATYQGGTQTWRAQTRVTMNLYQALKALRHENDIVTLWIDSLCINQQNKKEQAQQVQLMAHIYSQAHSVVIWLGPESPHSEKALLLLRRLADAGKRRSHDEVKSLIQSLDWRSHFQGLVSLFDRPYWKRLWVVQEVLIGLRKGVTVYCGDSHLDWSVFEDASKTLKAHIPELRDAFPRRFYSSQDQRSFSTVLTSQGPASLSLQAHTGDLHKMLRVCRNKLASEPRDKVMGIMSVMPDDVRKEFTDYNAPLRKIYIDVADFVLHNSLRSSILEPAIDIICDAIHFPLHNSSLSLPSWVPDWSHIPDVQPLSRSYSFRAATTVKCDFRLEIPRTKLDLATVHIGKVKSVGVAVGTFCKIDDYLMAFLNWRNKFLESSNQRGGNAAFCRTIRLDQHIRWPEKDDVKTWFHVFASLIRERLPYIRIDSEGEKYAKLEEKDTGVRVQPGDDGRTKILQENACRIQGRRFFITDRGHLGLGTGFLDVDDEVCVPWGGSTPIVLRRDGRPGECSSLGTLMWMAICTGQPLIR